MNQTLAIYFTQYLQNPRRVEAAITTPVVLYEPPEHKKDDPDTDARYRYKTMSGFPAEMLAPGEPLVFPLAKTKDNAFQRGVTVGRTANNDFVLDDGSVSRFHAWFQRDERGEWSVVDAGSKNGTLVNGLRLTAKRPSVLGNETLIKFGQVEVRFLPVPAFFRLLKGREG